MACIHFIAWFDWKLFTSNAVTTQAQAKVLKLQEDIAQLMKVSKYQQNAVEVEKKSVKEVPFHLIT